MDIWKHSVSSDLQDSKDGKYEYILYGEFWENLENGDCVFKLSE